MSHGEDPQFAENESSEYGDQDFEAEADTNPGLATDEETGAGDLLAAELAELGNFLDRRLDDEKDDTMMDSTWRGDDETREDAVDADKDVGEGDDDDISPADMRSVVPESQSTPQPDEGDADEAERSSPQPEQTEADTTEAEPTEAAQAKQSSDVEVAEVQENVEQDEPPKSAKSQAKEETIRPTSRKEQPMDPCTKATKENIDNAKAVTRAALAMLSDEADPAKQAKRQANSAETQGAGLKRFIKKKVLATSDLIKEVEDRIDSLEDTMRQVGECLFQLQRAQRSKWAPLSVCERRLELRTTRPEKEQAQDQCQQALERERDALGKAREELGAQVESTKEMLVNMEEMRGELAQVLAHKRVALKSDRASFSPRLPPTKATPRQDAKPEKLVLPKVPNSPRHSQLQQSQYESEATATQPPKVEPRSLLAKAAKMQEDAMSHCNGSDVVILETKQATAGANAETIAALSIQHRQTHKLRKQVEAQLREVDAAILASERLQVKTLKKVRDHEHPRRLLQKQFDDLKHMREEEGEVEEGKRDPVREELEAHLEQIEKGVAEQTSKWESTDKLLEQLREAKEKLIEDLKSKTLVLKIEEACLKVTPRKALELDRTCALGGRYKGTSRKPSRQQQLEERGMSGEQLQVS